MTKSFFSVLHTTSSGRFPSSVQNFQGDVVAIYLPMVLELPIAMLACARIGAVHSVVFAGYSADALAARILQARARVLITGDIYFRGKKLIPVKSIANQALDICSSKVGLVVFEFVCRFF